MAQVDRREFLRGLGAVLSLPFLTDKTPLRFPPTFDTLLKQLAGEETVFDQLMAPFANMARERRQYRYNSEPGYDRRIDWQLNDGRINLLFFVRGESFEPPKKEPAIIGSHTIASYNSRRKVVDLISITHDTRAPEIERFVDPYGWRFPQAIKIDQAYQTGEDAGSRQAGFDLQRKVLENATGLSIDAQFVTSDEAVVNLVNNVFGTVNVISPRAFGVNQIFYKGVMYPRTDFPAGEQELNGLQVIQYIKAVPEEVIPSPELEHNVRKHQVFKAMLNRWQNTDNPVQKSILLGKMVLFTGGSITRNQAIYDFDEKSLLIRNLKEVGGALTKAVIGGSNSSIEPEIGQTLYIVDKRQSMGGKDMGIGWVVGNSDEIIRRDFSRKVYVDYNMEVPHGGDPYVEDETQLPFSYWAAVRAVVRRELIEPIPTQAASLLKIIN